MMQEPLCRLCAIGSLSIALSIPNAPRNIQRLLKSDELSLDHSIHLSVYSCRHCGFVQIPPILEEEYYDDYLMGTTHSLQMQAYQDSQAERFVGEYGLEGKRVIEVGCGDGSFLDHLSAKGALVSGIEPSARFRTRALARGHNVEEGYISADRKLSGGAFDGFVTRQVLEHVPDIHGFLTGIRNNLAPGAVGLIEVPSLEKALKDQRYYDFFADHVNYFSLDTLRLAVELNGFKVLEQYHDMYDEYNVVHVRVADRSDLSAVQATLFSLGSELHDLISNASAQGKRVIMWGSGGKGLSVLAAAGIRDVYKLVDSDPNKQGRYSPVTHLLVEAPTRATFIDVDTVVITAMAYHKEIIESLRGELAYQGKILLLGKRLTAVGRKTSGE